MTDETPSAASEAPPVDWSRDDLVRRLLLALRIAGRTLHYLGDRGYVDSGEEDFGPDKPLAETAMLLHVASRVTDVPEVATQVALLARELAGLVRQERTLCAIALYPTVSLQLAMPHILMRELGLPDERFDRVLALSLTSQAQGGREVVPHRALEACWLRGLWCGKYAVEDTVVRAAAIEASVLKHPLDLLCGDRDDAYALTHDFMYLTGFGDLRAAFPRRLPVILAEVEGALARSLLDGDYDLAAELLMAWPLTATPWSPRAAFGFRVLTGLEDEIGVLPAWDGVPSKFEEKRGEERTRYALAANYHTALVMGMLAALALRPGRAPLAVMGASQGRGLPDSLLDAIGDPHAPWRRNFEKLDRAVQRPLGPFLLDVALIAAVRRSDFGGVTGLLRVGAAASMAATPLAAQATELVQRIAAAAGSAAHEAV
jgi:hypothetical protein